MKTAEADLLSTLLLVSMFPWIQDSALICSVLQNYATPQLTPLRLLNAESFLCPISFCDPIIATCPSIFIIFLREFVVFRTL